MFRCLRVAVPTFVCLAGACILAPFYYGRETAQAPGPAGHSSLAERQRTLLFAGDVMLLRGVESMMKARNDWAYPFHAIAKTLRAADLVFCNLECPISDQGSNQHHLYSFRANPRVLEGLNHAGFRIVSLANNHVYDWGPAAMLDSLERLRAAGIRTVGAGQNDLEAHYPTIVAVGGLRVAFLAYVNIDPKEAVAGVDRPGVAWLEPARVMADIRFARPLADLIVVCPHWGAEYASSPSREQVTLAHQMIDAGVDLVVGSHPHVTQPIEQYRGRWIAYSLGNFVFDQKYPLARRGMLLKLTVRGRQITEVVPVPILINTQFQALLAPAPTPAPSKPASTRPAREANVKSGPSGKRPSTASHKLSASATEKDSSLISE